MGTAVEKYPELHVIGVRTSGLWFVCLIAAALPWAVSAQAQAGASPEEKSAGYEKRADVVYATYGSRQMHLDLYLPSDRGGPFPAIVYIYGSGWNSGDRRQFSGQASYMAARGFVGACIEHRPSAEAKYPAALEDAVAAVRWLRDNAGELRVNPNRIGAVGGSSGGHLVALLGTTKGRMVQAVAAFNPVLDFADPELGKAPNVMRNLTNFLGAPLSDNPSLWREASPATQVNADSAPFLFLHGNADQVVPYRQSVEMVKRLQAAGVPAEIFTAPGADHGFFNNPPWFEPTEKRMEQFFLRYLRNTQ